MKRLITFLSITTLLGGCVEDIDLKLSIAEPRLVVEGVVTNQPGPYFVRLTKSTPGGLTNNSNSPSSSIDNAEPVDNALVIISDNYNQIDTLKLVTENDFLYCNKGFYKTTHLKGISGHTYSLRLIDNDKEYKATAYMPFVPEIDSLGYTKKISEKDGQKFYIPLLSFKEPQGVDNYYLFQLNKDLYSRIYSTRQEWKFSILSDVHLTPYVSKLNICTGENPRGIRYFTYLEGDSIYVALNSLSREAYDYYKVLLNQFNNDGGTYTPAPTTPPGNISNGALGLFRASSVSEKRTKIPANNIIIWPMN